MKTLYIYPMNFISSLGRYRYLCFLLIIVSISFVSCDSGVAEHSSERPNVLLIMTDDLGYGDLALYGNADVSTPHLDDLGKQSVILDPFYSQPVCAPSRAQLMTGRHFLKTGVWGVHGGRDYLNLDESTIAEMLQDTGYHTAFIGKWHLGKQGPYLPQYRGFNEVYRQTDLYKHQNPTIDDGTIIEKKSAWTTDYFTERALNIINKEREEPYFLYLAYTAVHEPYNAPERLVSKYEAKGFSKSLSTLYAMTEHLDEGIGRILEVVDNNTLLIFLSDNGPIGNPVNMAHLTEEELLRRNPKNFRGLKGNVWENGNRVPAFFKYGSRWPHRVSQTIGDIGDILPTILDVVGLDDKSNSNKTIDGLSLLPILKGTKELLSDRKFIYANHETYWSGKKRLYDFKNADDTLVFERTSLSIRHDDKKIVRCWYAYEDNTIEGSINEYYILNDDPKELTDISTKYADTKKHLYNDLSQWWHTEVIRDNDSYNHPTFHIGYDKEKETKLLACAPAKVHGDLTMNALTAENWNSADDSITFSIKVSTPGVYKVSTDLRKGDAEGSFRLTTAHSSLVSAIRSDFGDLGELKFNGDEQWLTLSLASGPASSSNVVNKLHSINLRPISSDIK